MNLYDIWVQFTLFENEILDFVHNYVINQTTFYKVIPSAMKRSKETQPLLRGNSSVVFFYLSHIVHLKSGVIRARLPQYIILVGLLQYLILVGLLQYIILVGLPQYLILVGLLQYIILVGLLQYIILVGLPQYIILVGLLQYIILGGLLQYILRIQFVTHIFIGSSALNVSIYSENRRGIYFSPQKRLKHG